MPCLPSTARHSRRRLDNMQSRHLQYYLARYRLHGTSTTEMIRAMAIAISLTAVWQRMRSQLAFAAVLTCICVPAFPAAYPDHSVRLIVPSPTGGGTDTSTRIIAPKLAEYLGQ